MTQSAAAATAGYRSNEYSVSGVAGDINIDVASPIGGG